MPDFGLSYNNTTEALSNKTISPVTNTMPYYGSTAYSIHPHGGLVQLRNNGNGTTTSYSTLDDAITVVFANTNDPTVTIHSGYYNLPSDYAGLSPPRLAKIICKGQVYINVPSGYTGNMWNFSPNNADISYVHIEGGIYDEQLPASSNWNFLDFSPTGSSPYGAVYSSTFRDIKVWRCNKPINFNTSGVTWVNQNHFENLYFEACKYIGATMNHTGTYTINQSGMQGNTFINVSGQATLAQGSPNYLPATVGGWIIDYGQYNVIMSCYPWDMYQRLTIDSNASTCTLGSNANKTEIIGGLVTSQNFQTNNLGTGTIVLDAWNGLYLRQPLQVIGEKATFNGPATDWMSAITVSKKTATGFENVANFGIDSSDDLFSIENGTNASGSFNTILRAVTTSTNSLATLTSLYITGYIKNANDVSNTVPVVELSARQAAGNLVNRPMVGISNHFDVEYLFYPNRADFLGNELHNVVLPQNKFGKFLYHVYIDTADSNKYKALNYSTGAITDSGSSTDCLSLMNTVISGANTAGKAISIGKGLFKFSAQLDTSGKYVTMEGATASHHLSGKANPAVDTVFKKTYTDNTNAFVKWSNNVGGHWASYTKQTWKNICFEGKDSNNDGTGTFDNGGIGFEIIGANEIYEAFKDCNFFHFGTGMRWQEVWQFYSWGVSFYNMGAVGIEFTWDTVDESTKCFCNVFYGGEFRNMPKDILLTAANDTQFFGTMIEGHSSQTIAVDISNMTQNTRLYGCSFESPKDGATIISDGGGGTHIQNGRFGGLSFSTQIIYKALSTAYHCTFENNVVEPYTTNATAQIILNSGSSYIKILNNDCILPATGVNMTVTDNSGNSHTNLILGNSDHTNGVIDNVVGGKTTLLSSSSISQPLTVYRPTNSTFATVSINLDQQTSTGARKTFGRISSLDDDRTNGAEYTWLGFEYMQNGVLDIRGMFYNDGVYFGRSVDSKRVGIINSGISGGNKTFTLPNLSGEITTNNATQTLSSKTIKAKDNTLSGIAQNPIYKRWGAYQPITPSSGSTAAVVGKLEGILANHVPTGPGTNTNSWDSTEGLLTNLITTTTTNQNAGLVSPTGSIGMLRRERAARMVYRGKIDTVAGGVSRLYFGVSSNNAFPTSDTIANGDSLVIIGFKAGATNYEIYHNDGTSGHATTTITGTIAKNTSFHTIELEWAAGGNPTITFDGTSQTISTDIPATTTNLFFHCLAQNATGAIRTHSIVGVWVESE